MGTKNLVWSGACIFNNRNTYDFRAIGNGDSSRLSFIVSQGPGYIIDRKGVGLVMNSSFDVSELVNAHPKSERFDMHEFRVIEGEESRLLIATEIVPVNVTELNLEFDTTWINSYGFQERGRDGNILFEWWALDHISLMESMLPPPKSQGSSTNKWDPMQVTIFNIQT
jgi:hypothetical protein